VPAIRLAIDFGCCYSDEGRFPVPWPVIWRAVNTLKWEPWRESWVRNIDVYPLRMSTSM
jgi:hypothetical protein